MSGFLPPGTPPPAEELANILRSFDLPSFTGVLALLGDLPVAAGGVAVRDQIATFFGVTVLEPFRRQGIQLALLAARFDIAAHMGADLATITSRPGVATERNARRMGFQLAYTNVAMIRPGNNLIGESC